MNREWREVRIGDLGKVVTGKTPKTTISENYGGNIPFLTPSDNMSTKYLSNTIRTLSQRGLSEVKSCLLPPNSVCVSCIGSDLGKVVITTKPTVTNQQINSIILDSEYDTGYIYYALKILGEELNYVSKSSTAVPIVNKSSFSNYVVKVPPLPEQKKIAEALSSIDDKIALNCEINHHLEQIAQAIFKSWFVNFEPWGGEMPSEWKNGTLSDIAIITMGQSPDGSSYNEEGFGAVFYQGRAEFGSRFPTCRLFTTHPKRMAKEGEVLLSVRAPVGDINVAYEPCCIGRGLASIHNKNYPSFILYTLLALKQQLDVFNGKGTVFGSINKDDLSNVSVLIPSMEAIRQFEEIVKPMDAQIKVNYSENVRLQIARDILLSLLLSGELSISDAK